MTNAHTRPLSSLTAIAAASLLLSTPAPAQSAQPPDLPSPTDPTSPAQPEVPPQPHPAPDPITPEASTSPAPAMTTNPVVQSLPDSSETPAAATPHPHAAQAATPSRAAAEAAETTASRAPAASTTTPNETPPTQPSPGITRRDPAGLYTTPSTTTPSANAPSDAAPGPAQSPTVRYWPLEAGGGIILLGLIAYAATRRREEDEDAPAPTASPAPEVTPAPRTAVATNHDSPALVGPVPTGAAREALLKRMVDAPPDAANPFTTRKARMHRARLILQSRKQALHERAVETFDWRTYRPSLTHPTLGLRGKKDPADHDT